MGIQTLVDFDIEAGRKVLSALADDSVDVAIALWAKLEDYGDWRLFLSSHALDRMPLLEAYMQIGRATDRVFTFNPPTVIYMTGDDPFMRAIRDRFSGIPDTYGARLSSAVLGGHFVEDAFIYRVLQPLAVQAA